MHKHNEDGFALIFEVLFLAAVITVIGLMVVMRLGSADNFDENQLPKFIQADFIELDKVESISPFRSGAGHDYSTSDEPCRSMKHYYSPYAWARGGEELANKRKDLDLKGLPQPDPVERLSTYIFSPVDGVITVNEASHLGRTLGIRPDSHHEYYIDLGHVFPLPGMTKGTKIRAGQKIAFTGNSTDMAIWAEGQIFKHRLHYVSYFSVMPDSIFARYQARGVNSRSDLIFTREYRDAHPFKCQPNSQEFAEDYGATRPKEVNFILTPMPKH